MSTLKTHNLQSPDAGSVNIVMAPNAGMVVAGLSTYSNQINVGNNIKLGNAGVITATTFSGDPAGTGNIDAGILDIKTGGNIRLRFSSGGTAQFRGDTDPIASFDRGSANSTNVTWGYLGADRGKISSISNEFRITASGTTPMTFHANSAERLRITSAGAVGIGTDTPAGGSYLHVHGSGASDKPHIRLTADRGLIARLGDTSGSAQAMFDLYDTDGSTQIVRFISGGGDNFINTGGNVGINETSPDSLLHLTTNSSTAYSTSEVNTVNATNALLRLENTNGGDGSGVNNYVGIYFRVANGANSDSQLQYVRTGDNAGAFHFKARNAGSTYPNLMTLKSDGNTGFDGVIDPKSPVHLGSNTEMRIGGQYGGLSPIMMQVQYAAGYTGTHWMFETNNMISWSFDGVLIVYGGGGSSYGSEVTKITIVYSRESGANNSGDIWRNGTTDYNIQTLGHGQVGLSPSSGSLTVTEDTAPDGAGSQRSLFKLGWTTAGHGGSTTTWSKLHGTMYWGTGSSGDVEIQDKDGNIFWDSNP